MSDMYKRYFMLSIWHLFLRFRFYYNRSSFFLHFSWFLWYVSNVRISIDFFISRNCSSICLCRCCKRNQISKPEAVRKCGIGRNEAQNAIYDNILKDLFWTHVFGCSANKSVKQRHNPTSRIFICRIFFFCVRQFAEFLFLSLTILNSHTFLVVVFDAGLPFKRRQKTIDRNAVENCTWAYKLAQNRFLLCVN